MKRILFLISITLTTLLNPFYSQYNFDVGFNFGGTGYLGDIGGTGEVAKGFLGDIVLKQTNITAGIYGRYKQDWIITRNQQLKGRLENWKKVI